MDRDLVNRIKLNRVPTAGAAAVAGGLLPLVRTATTLSAALDLQGYHAAMVILQVGAYGDAASGSVYLEAELQESSDNSTYTAVADSDLLFPPGDAARVGTATGTFFQSKTTGATDLSGTYAVGYRGNKRYIKTNLRVTGTFTTGTSTAVVQIAGFPDYSPVTGNAT